MYRDSKNRLFMFRYWIDNAYTGGCIVVFKDKLGFRKSTLANIIIIFSFFLSVKYMKKILFRH